MTTVLYVILALAILSVFVTLHELGHYCAGRLLGFGIVEFSVGMGPAIIKKEIKGITYALRAFPVGGMCRFYGEDQETGDGLAFGAQKPWKRAIVLVSGAMMNILTAILIAVIVLTALGVIVDYTPTIESFSFENSPAQTAGILPGDVITAIDGKPLTQYAQLDSLTEGIIAADNGDCVLSVEREGETLEFTVENMYNEEAGRNLMGVQIGAIPVRERLAFFPALGYSFQYIWEMVKGLVSFFGMLFQGQVQRGDVVGPVGIVVLIKDAVLAGVEQLLEIAVLISANLGLFNLLPLPALDGGRLVFVAIEAIRKKPIAPEKEGLVHLVGIVILLGLVVYLSVGDVSSLFGG